jgi:hypothetical protein
LTSTASRIAPTGSGRPKPQRLRVAEGFAGADPSPMPKTCKFTLAALRKLE